MRYFGAADLVLWHLGLVFREHFAEHRVAGWGRAFIYLNTQFHKPEKHRQLLLDVRIRSES